MAAEKGLGVDVDGFNAAMEEQKQTAKNSRKDGSSWDDDTSFDFKGIAPTEFVGYTSLEAEAEIKGMETNEGNGLHRNLTKRLSMPKWADRLGDIGTILQNGEVIGNIVNTTKTGDGLYVHHTELLSTPEPGTVVLKVDKTNRMAISRNHSATHLLHKALKEILGSHVAQAALAR